MRRHQQGSFIIETMVAALVVAVGLLGLISLQSTADLQETENYRRSQALVLLQDISSRLQANQANAGDYVTGSNGPLGTGDSQPTNCNGLTGAALDLCEWSIALKGLALDGDSSTTGLKDARGCIEPTIAGGVAEYQITVAWSGMTRSSASSNLCAAGLYADESLRRTMVAVVRIPSLANTISMP